MHLQRLTSTSSLPPPIFSYGTAGYRANWSLLPTVVFRTSSYAAHRARRLGKAVGLMLTASHNPPEDNGVKVIDWTGQMLPIECEAELDILVNASDADFRRICLAWLNESGASPSPNSSTVAAKVVIGTDTRESSPALLKEAVRGCRLMEVPHEMNEEHTTPQLHFIVRANNDRSFAYPDDYVDQFSSAFKEFLSVAPFTPGGGYTPEVYLDCANGVGALWMSKYLGTSPLLAITTLNTDTKDFQKLNSQCGADYVKIKKQPPLQFNALPLNKRCASLDGDADRLVYFYIRRPEGTHRNEVRILDGDHIAALFARFIKDINEAKGSKDERLPFTFGVVQTAYANGNSTRYFRNKLHLEPLMVKTGVKYLDKAARQFDIGIYFEANGHGTVAFSDHFHRHMTSIRGLPHANVPRQVTLIHLFSKLVNEVVGDGIADFLAVETLLRYYNWSVADWEAETYYNLPSCQLKVPVIDRSLYTTEEEKETVLVEPPALQQQINSIVDEYQQGRAFVRPSGTEEILRIYAEAGTQEEANEIARRVEVLLKRCEKESTSEEK